MRYSIAFLFIAFLLSDFGYSQNGRNDLERTLRNATLGLYSAAEVYDLPVFLLYLNREELLNEQKANFISFAPLPFEKSINEFIGKNERESFGSVDKDIFPMTYFYGHLAYLSARSLLGDKSITAEHFRKPFLFYKAIGYTYMFTELFKTTFNRVRPDGTNTRSFFSGHTSTTFAAATFINLELQEYLRDHPIDGADGIWQNVASITIFSALYGWAGYVGYSRIADNRHYLLDVIGGAAAGTLISTLVYNTYLEDAFKEPNLLLGFNPIIQGFELRVLF